MTFTNKDLIIDTSNFTTSKIWRLENSNGNAGDKLTTDGNGNISWQANEGGTVTSVGIAGNNGITVADSPVTNSGTINIGLENITPNSVSSTESISVGTTLQVNGKIFGYDQSQFNGMVSVGDYTHDGLLRIYSSIGGSGGFLQLFNDSGQPNMVLSGGGSGSSAQLNMTNGWHEQLSIYTDSTGTNLKLHQKDINNLGFVLTSGNGSSSGANMFLYGLGLNGNIEFYSTTTDTGDTSVNIDANSTNSNNVDLNLAPHNNGHVNVQSLRVNGNFSTDSAISGNATLISGVATISTVAVTAGSVILLSVGSLGSVAMPQVVHYDNINPGVSFDIISVDPTDTSIVSWLIIN
jgi:hypothetical protein